MGALAGFASASQVSPLMELQKAIDMVDKYFYFVGDDNHRYAFCCITKELGDLLINKYPDDINNGAIRIESVVDFDLSQTDLNKGPIDFEEFWTEYLKFDDDISRSKGYRTFEDFKKGEGFE